MKKIALLLLLAAITACSDNQHFITDTTYRTKVSEDFNKRKAEFSRGGIFDIFNTEMTTQEREAMQFLYAYMPMGDYTDYPADLFLSAVRSSLSVRNEVAWGKDIPEDVFRHFVLPVRANNEHLDTARTLFYRELIDRVKSLPIEQAAIEVNRWCHTKVTYRPSDARTSSPLASMKTAHGRCGEESVFAVAAMRAVGIPARQVYTPRWAHTDDNHAWIEVWTPDGTWKYMGACEPEPKLNMGWFSDPVQRGMLMHTKAFGLYAGKEEFIGSTPCFTEVNSTENYAPTAKAKVVVKNSDGTICEGAKLFFGIYNYAEFYPCIRRTTDNQGIATAVTGHGDLYAYAQKDGAFGDAKISVGRDSLVEITLNRRIGEVFTQEVDIVPPVGGKRAVTVTDEERAENNTKTDEENSVRASYEATFMNEKTARALATELALDADKVSFYISESRGNWQTIEQFLREVPTEKRPLAMALLSSLSMKDLRDISIDVLNDSFATGDLARIDDPIYVENVLNPRVSMEMLTPYKDFFAKNFSGDAVDYINKNIKLNNTDNSYRVAMTPMGVWRCGVADDESRNILYVALNRSIGIPARIDYLTGKVQYYSNGWIDMKFGSDTQSTVKAKTGLLKINYIKGAGVDDPLYDRHFTIKRFDGKEFRLLNFRSADGTEGTASMLNLFSKGETLEEGFYLLTTGTRMASGKALVGMQTFNIKEGEQTIISTSMREDKTDIQVIGALDAEALFMKEGETTESSILNTTGRGYFIVGVIKARHEPTTHTIRDFVRSAEAFEKWGRKMILLFENESDLKAFNKTEYGKLPSNIVFGVDNGGKITKMLTEGAKIDNANARPIFVIADTFGRIVYSTSGYSIGVGEQMLTTINKL